MAALGSPIAIEIANTEWDRSPEKWQKEMSPGRGRPTEVPLTQPRPGHADLAGMQKYGFVDARDVLERLGQRDRSPGGAGAVAKAASGARSASRCCPRGADRRSPPGRRPARVADLGPARRREVRCLDPGLERR